METTFNSTLSSTTLVISTHTHTHSLHQLTDSLFGCAVFNPKKSPKGTPKPTPTKARPERKGSLG
jgi:hypothetical protein